MKTVWDAVNLLKGVACHNTKYIYDEKNCFKALFCASVERPTTLACTIAEFDALVAEMETNFGKYTGAKFDASKATELEPQPPAYTQEMHDNGECPKLGAKFEVEVTSHGSRLIDFEGYEVTVIGISITKDNKQVITFEHDTRGVGCGVFRKSWVKPLPPKQVLFNGKAYQFNSESVGNCGIYSDEDGLLHGTGNEVVRVEDCTNITLLTPEGK